MASSELVCVETSNENAIIEVSYDGQEFVQPPLTMSEHLSKQAHKIDFESLKEDIIHSEEEDPIKGEKRKREEIDKESSSEDEEESKKKKQNWPWENVRNKLKDALTELCVLSDVLTVATKDIKDKRYMVLDGPVQAETPEPRPYVSLVAKKKSLDAPARILLQGAENLKGLMTAEKTTKNSVNEFHTELLRLRQNWRLKKVSNTILGDLSYQTAGSQYKQSGVFEVTKAPDRTIENDGIKKQEDEGPRSALNVTVPSELEGIAFIQVTIQKESEHMMSANLNPSFIQGSNVSAAAAVSGNKPGEMHWQKKLEQAQNVLFCKELFARLAKEAIQVKSPVPHLVVGTQIIASLFTDIQLIISLCHSNGSGSSNGTDKKETGAQRDHSHVLEHTLYQLLRQAHSKNINPEGPCLSSAPVGVSKKRRLAGPTATDRYALLEMAKQETILEKVIAQAQHVVLRLRTMFVLDTMARDLKDPLITCHWSTLSSPTATSVKVLLMTTGYDTIIKTQLVIKVEEKKLTVICRDGKVLRFSHEPQELRDFILCQIASHQINGVQALAKVTGWRVISSSNNLGLGQVEPLGNAGGVLLASPSGDKFIAIRLSPITHTSIHVSSAPCKDFYPGAIIEDHKKWVNLPDSFQELRLDKMDGKNFLSKLELLMSALVSGV